ncbi:DUF4395 domain-containing protein [Microbacterium sp. LRZ72]|uniref:DUF4395 family protein n=1 Tax=Microbacterium sp. LRZ72 TaxID=2942481 RepID=UPI0029BA536C|nr:DUF4395 family protein [Microbacterium sp. LRZ72]MDX2376055.1 DUF4395 domain-containing protein [Microbacterium sp. LRZ72]
MQPSQPEKERPVVGQWVEGLDVPVVNERAVRASAGILFLGGFSTWLWGVVTDDLQPMRIFGIVFVIEMMLRRFVGTGLTPTLLLGALITRPQRPEWVEARSKLLAWRVGSECLWRGASGDQHRHLGDQRIAARNTTDHTPGTI